MGIIHRDYFTTVLHNHSEDSCSVSEVHEFPTREGGQGDQFLLLPALAVLFAPEHNILSSETHLTRYHGNSLLTCV